jgi:hypothetical protein
MMDRKRVESPRLILAAQEGGSIRGRRSAKVEDAVGIGDIVDWRCHKRVGSMPLPSGGVVLVQKQKSSERVVTGRGEGVVAKTEKLPLFVPRPCG